MTPDPRPDLDDPLRAARGIGLGVVLGAGLWAGIVAVVLWVLGHR